MAARPVVLLLIAASAWTALAIAAPLLGAPLVYRAAGHVCHQLPDRTFHLASGPFAVCARCLGLYAGGLAGLIASMAAGGRVFASRPRMLVALGAAPTVLTLGAEWLLHWPIDNLARFAAALPLGGAAAWVVARAIEVDWRS